MSSLSESEKNYIQTESNNHVNFIFVDHNRVFAVDTLSAFKTVYRYKITALNSLRMIKFISESKLCYMTLWIFVSAYFTV